MTERHEFTLNCPTVVGARDVAKLRVWMHDQWQPQALFWSAAQLARVRLNRNMPELVNQAVALLESEERAEVYSRWERNTLRVAQLWWISHEMQDLLEAAMASVPDDVSIADVPQPDPAGLMVFQRPLIGHSADTDAPLPVHAVLWGPTNLPPLSEEQVANEEWNPGYSISSYSMVDLDAGLSPTQLTAHAGMLAQVFNEEGEVPDPGDERRVISHGQLWSTCGRSDWLNGTTVADKWLFGAELDTTLKANGTDLDTAYRSAVEDRKLMVAFWTLVHQAGIAETRITRPPRQEARRAMRAGWSREASDVRVVRLRELARGEPGEPTGEKRHYSHRFIVNGHWRNQACGPHRRERKLIWIHPYTKGDGELLRPTTVKAWVR